MGEGSVLNGGVCLLAEGITITSVPGNGGKDYQVKILCIDRAFSSPRSNNHIKYSIALTVGSVMAQSYSGSAQSVHLCYMLWAGWGPGGDREVSIELLHLPTPLLL